MAFHEVPRIQRFRRNLGVRATNRIAADRRTQFHEAGFGKEAKPSSIPNSTDIFTAPKNISEASQVEF